MNNSSEKNSTEPIGEPVDHPMVHTYQDDLANAMDATDASAVQELIAAAREREAVMKDEQTKERERGWYVAGSLILFFLAIGAAVYGVYYYTHLTVPVQKTFSPGVFATTEPVVAGSTDIRQLLKTFTPETVPPAKPMVVPLVENTESFMPITIQSFFAFIEAKPSEPFVATLEGIRLGIMNTGKEVTPFLIASVADSEIASKEFLIAEPTMVDMFYPSLGIDLKATPAEEGRGFRSEYFYNLPVRVLRAKDQNTGEDRTLLFYGYATEHSIVITTRPDVLKAVYDTIIKQR